MKSGFPGCHITWVVDPRFAGIVECCQAVDEVLAVKPSFKSIPVYDEPFEAALDLQGLLKSALCIARAKAKSKVGYHWQREGSWLFSGKIIPDPSSLHVVDQYVDVARAVGGVMDRAKFALAPKDEDLASVRSKLTERGIHDRFWVVNAGAGWASKRWAPVSFSAVIDGIVNEGLPVVLIGGKAGSDHSVAEAVIAGCKSKPANLLGETSVRELVALIGLCSGHLGGDTGSTHLAAAMDRPAVGLYSITRPERSCPYGQIGRCHYRPEGLGAIRPDEVLNTIREVLS
ncbi:MAG: glycosyltransferase family 9 protein [Fimbriimonas sp.]|nr:glycosyltransferase family 9 protein [Fimbriimonas sp.]